MDGIGHQPQDSNEERVVPETPDASSSSNPSSVPWFASELMAPPTVRTVTSNVGDSDDDDDDAAHPDSSSLEHFADLSVSRLMPEPAMKHSRPLQTANGGTQSVKPPAPPQKQKAKKGAPSFPSKTPNEHDPRTDHGTQRIPSKGHSELDKNEDPYLNPLERSVSPQPFNTHPDLGIERVSNYQDIFDDNQHRFVEAMTEEEIEQKVAQIKSRPSRKSYFCQISTMSRMGRGNHQRLR
jgi:hypothetical protein